MTKLLACAWGMRNNFLSNCELWKMSIDKAVTKIFLKRVLQRFLMDQVYYEQNMFVGWWIQ